MKSALHAVLAAVPLLLSHSAAWAESERGSPEEILPEILGELLRDEASDDQRTDEAALIVGALLGLAALERASREEVDEEDVPEEAIPDSPLATQPAPVLVPRIPARPAEVEDVASAPEPEPTQDPVAPPLVPPTVLGEPSLDIPPPPPLAEEQASGSSMDFSEAFDRAAQDNATGF